MCATYAAGASQREPLSSRQSVPLVVVVWLIVGAILAGGHHYFDTLNSIGTILTAVLAVVLWLSFADGLPGDPALAYSLKHYGEILLDGFTYRVLWNTLVFSLVTLLVSLLLLMPLAWLI